MNTRVRRSGPALPVRKWSELSGTLDLVRRARAWFLSPGICIGKVDHKFSKDVIDIDPFFVNL